MVGETNRAPFDLPEAEGELVGGFHTEYSAMKFAMFFLAEYINMATVSALATTLFLGGWGAPWGIEHIWEGANDGYWPLLWFFGKMLIFIFMFIWLRGTLPRLRYDQFMALRLEGPDPGLAGLDRRRRDHPRVSLSGDIDRHLLVVGVVVGAARRDAALRGRRAATRRPRPPPADERPDAFAGGFPVPPMDLQVPPRPRRRAASVAERPPTDRRTATRPGAASSEDGDPGETLGPVAGFGVTFRTMFRKVVTEQYPFEKLPTAPRFHGRHQLNRYPTAWRSASAASCAPGRARRTPSTSRAPRTPRTSGSAPVSATAASTRSTTCAASSAGCASRRARRGRSR